MNRKKSKTDINNTDIAISIKNVSKIYPLYKDAKSKLYQSLWNFVPGFFKKDSKKFYTEFQALNAISFEVRRGECLGIIGQNGSGKSTTLQIIAGILSPTKGNVIINGKVTAILELGSGFSPEFTGRENVYINGALSGFTKKDLDNIIDDIIEFADIGDFIDQPVKVYSSGMFVRLAFAVQACLEPDILIIDEVLSVGDIFFQQKCHARIEELIAGNTAVILVSHNMPDIEKYCSKVIVLNKGNCLFIGQPNEAVDYYYQTKNLHEKKNIQTSPADYTVRSTEIQNWPPQSSFLNLSRAIIIGDQTLVKCTGISLCNEANQPSTVFHLNETAYFYYEFEILQDIEKPVCGVRITNSKNINIHAKNTVQYSVKTPSVVHTGTRLRVKQSMQLTIAADEYTFSVYIGSIVQKDSDHLLHSNTEKILPEQMVILSIKQAGKILLNYNRNIMSQPFYDYVDLKGDCQLYLIDKED